ncbi:hypothetical protein [Streptomyces erythrochromogenes]|uniref:hypothetical protein n=1 Tax=Streptomyces erythrochromogenes TaxID=285574 RepID=UPI002251CCCE|nr:hypothetical protein [Streptomyces erythrochromogenes]MCX5584222.1 hypothetical protein [Streptomyces erythrochromogenes]
MSVDEGTWVRRMPVADEVALIRRLARKRAADAATHQSSTCLCEGCRMRWLTLQRRIRNGKAARRQAPAWITEPDVRESVSAGFVDLPDWGTP